MNIEIIILVSAWFLSIIMLVLFVPKYKLREAQLIFFIKQFMTWILGLITAELRLIEYPVRIFDYAAKTSFTFEYIVYPSICVVFGLYYPEGKSFIKKLMYYFYYCTGITIVEVILEKYTDVINYINWDWYMSWISLFITFYLSRKYYKWFFGIKSKNMA